MYTEKLYMNDIFKKKSFSKMFFELFVKFEKFHFLKIELKLSDMSTCISIIDIFQGKYLNNWK